VLPLGDRQELRELEESDAEGVLRQAERLGDRYVDHALYSMLAPEWPSRR
jgi:hypothetical protein